MLCFARGKVFSSVIFLLLYKRQQLYSKQNLSPVLFLERELQESDWGPGRCLFPCWWTICFQSQFLVDRFITKKHTFSTYLVQNHVVYYLIKKIVKNSFWTPISVYATEKLVDIELSAVHCTFLAFSLNYRGVSSIRSSIFLQSLKIWYRWFALKQFDPQRVVKTFPPWLTLTGTAPERPTANLPTAGLRQNLAKFSA